jgi:hypothetical protein
LRWEFDFNNWLQQPLFMRDCVGPYADKIEEFARRPPPIIDQAVLLWNVIYGRVNWYTTTRRDWLFVRHEDLSTNPAKVFAELYSSCGLRFDADARQFVDRTSSGANPAEATLEEFKLVERNSAEAARIWMSRLSPDEVKHIRQGTELEASTFYSSADWEPEGNLKPGAGFP